MNSWRINIDREPLHRPPQPHNFWSSKHFLALSKGPIKVSGSWMFWLFSQILNCFVNYLQTYALFHQSDAKLLRRVTIVTALHITAPTGIKKKKKKKLWERQFYRKLQNMMHFFASQKGIEDYRHNCIQQIVYNCI